MKLIDENITETFDEHYLIETLNLNDKVILELGCGDAAKTKQIAQTGFNRKIIAYEIDEIQHNKNVKTHFENIQFVLGAAEDIKLEDNSVDIVFMFKSFHHIQKEFMPNALNEIKRVLKPNGLAYISEPLFYGDQNYLISLFHDEQQVRIDAFEAIKNSVNNNQFKLFKEIFFQTEVNYESFEDFEKKQINLSYISHSMEEQLHTKIKSEYTRLSNMDGKASFLKPFRVDILQKIDDYKS
ncbi:MAG: class I SAM-dependent methyltransferase [Candidatus Marinarcus sp.]|uniref:class I SAM-dependent methyltransferase n=1 Tax=Candidatus Marinarcus sp. TaxID=3100987 RepID=UPI003AFF9D50